MNVRESKVWGCARSEIRDKLSELDAVMAEGSWHLERADVIDEAYIVYLAREVPESKTRQHTKN